MAFDLRARGRMPAGIGIALRGLAFGAFASAALVVATTSYRPASVILLSLLALVFLMATLRSAARTGPHRSVAAAIDAALDSEQKTRLAQQRQIDYLQALCDNVPVVLLTLDSKGGIDLVNRAAWNFFGQEGAHAVAHALGAENMALLYTLRPGSQADIRLPGRSARMLVHVSTWISGTDMKNLVALVMVDQMLDRVEMQAWRDLVRMLAHEMMNSLTPITSLAASLRPSLRQLQDMANPQEIIEDVSSALEMIERRSAGLLEFVARCRSIGEIPIADRQQVNVRALVVRTLGLLTQTRDKTPVATAHSIEPDELVVFADPALLEQALINLVRNAQDALAGAENPRIEVRGRRVGEFAVITVEDNGCGLSEEVSKKVFVPFFSTKTGGTGIGLTLVRQVVLAHGGRIEITSARARGTAVELYFPAATG
jgi:nitrogen fixation/metabolism regulation signal transduction histidine kinase